MELLSEGFAGAKTEEIFGQGFGLPAPGQPGAAGQPGGAPPASSPALEQLRAKVHQVPCFNELDALADAPDDAPTSSSSARISKF